jgi:methanethiol S-methyltransferase
MVIQTRNSWMVSAIAWAGALVFAGSLVWFIYCYLVRFGTGVPAGPVLAPVLANIALFSAFALHHSVLARTGAKTVVRRYIPAELERSLYTWGASLLFIAVCTYWQPVPGTLYRFEGGWALAGYAIQFLGLVLTVRGAAAVDALDLAGVRPVLHTAAGTAPVHVPLETRGLYGFVRHPLYFAWVLMVFGTPAMTATRATFAVVSALYLAVAIPMEERSLVDVFGPEYEEYKRNVRWRMIPGIY